MAAVTKLAGWHRALALMVVLPILAWSLTGLLHPIMTRWQPSAAAMAVPPTILNAPAGTSWQNLPAPARVLPKSLMMYELRPLTWQGEGYWMALAVDGTRRYFRATDGQPANIESALMIALARHYTGISTGTPELQLVTSFSDEYPFINRYLPVWRVHFSGQDTVAFIEPRGLRLSALSDPWKTWFSATFSQLHSWRAWAHEPSRDMAMAAILSVGLLVVMTGVLRLFRRRASTSLVAGSTSAVSRYRRWHRGIAWCVALGAVASMSSGLFHLLAINKSHASFNAHPPRTAFSAQQLLTLPLVMGMANERNYAIASAQGPLWLSYAMTKASTDEHAGHHRGQQSTALMLTLQRADNGHAVAIKHYIHEIASGVLAQYPHVSVAEPQAISHFTPEYGFVQKRLPAYQLMLDTPDHVAIYIDPIDAVVSSVVTDLARREGYSFAYLHKGLWLDFLGKDARDAILGAQALGLFTLACLGLLLARRRRIG